MDKKLSAFHGIICRLPAEKFSYFGWPTVTRLDNGTLLVVSSGLRSQHICPWGKTVLNVSFDDGQLWSPPRVINDSQLDDRDVGIVNLGGNNLLVSWFRSDNREYLSNQEYRNWLGEEEVASWRESLAQLTDAIVEAEHGSWVMHSADAGATWDTPVRAPVSSPHGPVRLRNGDLLYLGKPYGVFADMLHGAIQAFRSTDGGRSWQACGIVPMYPGTIGDNYHEPHLVELPSGKLIGAIRIENGGGVDIEKVAGIRGGCSIMMTDSGDGGQNWSLARPLNFHGSPPHLLRHSSGVLIMTYGYRQAPYGQRVAFSYNEGVSWEHDWIIRDDGPDWDLGYPSTVEMADGTLFTVCYQKVLVEEKPSLLWSRWTLPTLPR